MKKSPLLIALAFAVAAGAVGHLYLARLEAEVSGGPKVSLLVAAEEVPLGSTLSEKALAVRDVPEAYVDARQIHASDSKKILGARVSTALGANDAILWSDVAGASTTRALSTLVERGMRAVAIEARAGSFDGLLRPGDRVNVLFTASSGSEPGATSTLLQNLLVLSVGGSVAKTSEGGARAPGAQRGGSVTLSASVTDAQLITQAREHGRLSLTLRNADDIALATGVAETTAQDLRQATVGGGVEQRAKGGRP